MFFSRMTRHSRVLQNICPIIKTVYISNFSSQISHCSFLSLYLRQFERTILYRNDNGFHYSGLQTILSFLYIIPLKEIYFRCHHCHTYILVTMWEKYYMDNEKCKVPVNNVSDEAMSFFFFSFGGQHLWNTCYVPGLSCFTYIMIPFNPSTTL